LTGPTRIAGVDRRIGLNEILVPLDAEAAAAERADDTGSHGLPEAERIADRQHEIADLQAVGIADRHGDEILRRDLQQGDIGFGIPADQLCRKAAVVLGRDLDAGRVVDDVTIGQDIALRGIDDDAGAGRLGFALLGLLTLRQIEKPAEERILQQRVLGAHLAAHRDIDDARRDPRQHRRKARYRGAADVRDRRGRQRRIRRRHARRDAAHQDEGGQNPIHRREDPTHKCAIGKNEAPAKQFHGLNI
jgi:hypothetical protein